MRGLIEYKRVAELVADKLHRHSDEVIDKYSIQKNGTTVHIEEINKEVVEKLILDILVGYL